MGRLSPPFVQAFEKEALAGLFFVGGFGPAQAENLPAWFANSPFLPSYIVASCLAQTGAGEFSFLSVAWVYKKAPRGAVIFLWGTKMAGTRRA
jgi:hypothetical protein